MDVHKIMHVIVYEIAYLTRWAVGEIGMIPMVQVDWNSDHY